MTPPRNYAHPTDDDIPAAGEVNDNDSGGTVAMTLRLPTTLWEKIQLRGEEIDRSMNWVIRNWLQVMLERLEASTVDSPVDSATAFASEWASADERGSCGHSFETRVRFALPAVGDADFAAYDITDAMSQVASLMGARDVASDVWSYAPMQMDTRETGGVVITIG